MKDKQKRNAAVIRKTSIGGQALLEGIMMRGPEKTTMAVRDPNGNMVLEDVPTSGKKRPAICRWPLIRGVFGFVDSMVIGYKSLMRSAEIAMPEDEPKKDKGAKTDNETAEAAEPVAEAAGTDKETGKAEKKGSDSALMAVLMIVATILGFALAMFLFVWLPAKLYMLLSRVIPFFEAENRYKKSIFEGILKVIILVLYMAAVSLMKDIRRTFRYHGAEHKTIFCYEMGLDLTVENVRKQRRFHPRCGTSFLILMVLVGILISFLIPPTIRTIYRVLIKLALIPVIMGLGYELIKFAGRHDNVVTKIISAPGMWLQHITVLEPDDSMIECAIAAFKAVLPAEETPAGEDPEISDPDNTNTNENEVN